ncbi:MAG: glycosyltransferase, partial [Nitrospirota bacterium]
IQNKVLEALAAGLPVVATSVAVQGIGCNGDGFLFIEDSPLKFAERTVELAKRQLSNDVNEKRESFLKQKFSWKENFEKLGLIIEKNGGIKC